MLETELTFGAWLRRQRRQLDLTQLELAQRVGYSVVTIRKLERDELRPSKQLAEQLAQGLHIAPEHQVMLFAFARGLGPSPQLAAMPAPSVIAAAAPATGLSFRHHNLSAQTTPLVGREAELIELQRLLARPGGRLVTIVGAGGMGKTHLAQEVARQYLDSTQAQVFFVALAPVSMAEGVTTAILDALGYPLQQNQRSPEQQLFDYLQRKQLLLVLDNFEHLLIGAGLVNALLRVAPGLKILVTSREPLLLSGETLYRLDSLAYPGQGITADVLTYAAVQLFLARACHLQPTFEPSADDHGSIVRICRLVEGMPLGILLAAAWVNVLSLQAIADEISQSLDFLETELRDLPERHRSIRAVFAHSWHRLTEGERTVFMQLAVFRGGFTCQAAQRVTGALLRTLRALVNQSLLQVEQGDRYTLHELLRQYAAAELEAAQQSAATRERHCAYYVDWLAQRAGDLKGPRQAAALAEIETEEENVRFAWQWAVLHANREQIGQALESLGFFYEWRGRFQEGKRAFAQATESLGQVKGSTESPVFVRLLLWQAKFGRILGDRDLAEQLLCQAQACLKPLERLGHDTRSEEAVILHRLGLVAFEGGEPQSARPLYEQSLALFQALGDAQGEAGVLLDLGKMSRDCFAGGAPRQYSQQTEAAKRMTLASLAIYRVAGDQAHLANGLVRLGTTCLALGQAGEAQAALEECVAICQALGTISSTLIAAIGFLGVAKEYWGLYEQMRSQGQRALGLAQEIGDTDGLDLGYDLIGRAALAEKRYAEAQHWLQQDLALFNRMSMTEGLNFTLVNAGLASYGLGDTAHARQHLIEALRLGLEIHNLRGAVHGLLLGALLLAGQGKYAWAVELHALAMCYPSVANSRWCEDVTGRELIAVAESLPADVVAAARARGQASDLWATVAALLVELGHGE
jgi:predicted ATPase/transcriptional regulator with XRE-family HTH domain